MFFWRRSFLVFPGPTHVLIGSMADGATCVSHVVNQDSHTVLHIAHQNHPVHFICFLSLFMNQSKLHIQPVRNWCHPVKDAKEHGHTAHLRIYYWALGWGNSWIVNSLPWKNKSPSSIPRTHACDPSFWEAETCRSLGLAGLFCELQAGPHWETLL